MRRRTALTLQGRVGFAVVGAEIREGRSYHRHGVRIIAKRGYENVSHCRHTADRHSPEGAEKAFRVRMHHAVMHDLVLPGSELRRGRECAVDEEVRGLKEGRVLRELLDRVTSARAPGSA
jgi:hypothetical protein